MPELEALTLVVRRGTISAPLGNWKTIWTMKFSALAVMTTIAWIPCLTQIQAADGFQTAAKSIAVSLQKGIADDSNRGAKSDKPSEPDRPDATALNPDLKEVVTCFEQARDVFVSQQKD